MNTVNNFLICIYGRGGRIRGCGEGVVCQWVVQLILAYNWARPATLVTSKGRGWGCFILFLAFILVVLPVPLSLFLLPFSGRRHSDPHELMCQTQHKSASALNHRPWWLGRIRVDWKQEVTGSTPPRPAAFFRGG